MAGALDEVIAFFLIGGDLLLDGQIEFFRHFLALLGIVNDIEAVDDQRRRLFVEPAEEQNEVLENVYLIHIGVGDKVHVAGDAQLRCFKRAQVVGADRLDLLAVGAALVELKELLGAAAALRHIHGIIIYHVVAAENAVCLIVADVCQLFVLVGMAVQGFLHQLTGENARRVLIVTTVGEVDIRFAVGGDRHTLPNVSCGGSKRVRYRETVAPGVSNAHALTERGKRLFLYQKVGKRKIKKLSQHVLLITGGCTDKFAHFYDVIHIRVVPFFMVRCLTSF